MSVLAFARELGLELTPAQAEMVTSFVDGGHGQVVWQCGRRGGKTLLADLLALYDVVYRDHLRDNLRRGELRIAAIVAQNLDKSRGHVANCLSLVRQSPRLAAMVESETADEIRFVNQAAIRAYPCSARGLRGDPWSCCVLDELGHYVTSEEGDAAGTRVFEASLPSLAQFGDGGWLLAISTPLWKRGAFWRLVERATSGRFPRMHYRHLSTHQMNPRISTSWLEERQRDDAGSFAGEYLAEFVDGATSYLESSDVLGCVRRGKDKLAPMAGLRYVASLDPAYSHDSFALALAHKATDDGRSIVDGVWTWRRYGHERTLDAIREIAEAYNVKSLTTDQHCSEPIKEGLARRHLSAVYAPWTSDSKASAYARLKVGLNTRSVELPDDRRLIEELLGLEARPTPNGSTRIAAVGAGHDDRATATAAALAQLVGPTTSPEDAKKFIELNRSLRSSARSKLGFLGDGTNERRPW